MRVGLARVSTDQQGFQVALSNQIQRLREAGCRRIYADIASRTDEARAGVESLIGDIKSGVVNEVCVTVLDRATGSPALFDRLTKIMKQYEVPMIGLDESIDIMNEDGEMLAGFGVVLAKREVQRIRSRSQRGHASRRQNSRANSCPPFGFKAKERRYVWDETPVLCLISEDKCDDHPGRTVIDLAKDSIAIFWETKSLTGAVATIHKKYGIELFDRPIKLRKEARSFILDDDDDFKPMGRRTRRSLFCWSHKGLRNWLLNPVLRGHTCYGCREVLGVDDAGKRIYGVVLPQEQWDIRRDTHPDKAILTEQQYTEIKQWIDHNGKTKARWLMSAKDRIHPISGLLQCEVCGGGYKSLSTKKRNGIKINYYQCRNHGRGTCNQAKCIRNDRAEEFIFDELARQAELIEAYRRSPDEPKPKEESPELVELRKQLLGMKKLGRNPAIEQAIRTVENQIAQTEMAEMLAETNESAIEEDLLEIFQSPKFWNELRNDQETKMQVFQTFVERVMVQDGEIRAVRLRVALPETQAPNE